MAGTHSFQQRLKYWTRLLSFGLAGSLVFFCIAIEAGYIDNSTKAAASRVGPPPPAVDGIEYQSVVLDNAADDIHLSGWHIPSKNRAAIILLHGFGASRLEMKSRADALARNGYGVLLYNLRGHGESEGEKRAFGWEDVPDVEAAREFLSAEKRSTRIGSVYWVFYRRPDCHPGHGRKSTH